jgi:hypothetical protein
MTLNRLSFFFVLFINVILPFFIHKFIWLAGSEKTTGTMGFVSSSQTGQTGHRYPVISFNVGNNTIRFNGNDNILFKVGEPVPVRYQRDHPEEARIDVFSAIWGDTLVYSGIPVLILIVIFLDPKIIPLRSKVKLSVKKPFVKILANS